MKQTFNPCDECTYSHAKQNQESGMCNICEFKKLMLLEEKGRLPVLPCRIGDKLYEPRPDRGMISEYTVSSICCYGYGIFISWKLNSGIYSNLHGVPARQIGKTIFLTKEEAESYLKERQVEQNEQSITDSF